jgi:predicted amidohydrolase
MAVKKINISVLVQDTHNNGANYYGEPKANMVAAPLPHNIEFIRDCITTAIDGHRGEAPETIVVLPEFILQPQEGAYTDAQRTIVNNHMQTILNNTPDNVLVVFGTVVSENAGGGHFYNDLLYGIGNGLLRHTGKLLLSDIDLIYDATVLANIGWDPNVPPILKRNTPPKVWNQSPAANHTVNFKGKRIGFSICLDYAVNELLNRLGPGNNPVDINIVSSCGMEFIDSQRGIYKDVSKVIVCDAYGEWSSVRQVNQYGQSKQKSSFLTTESVIQGALTKIRRTQISVPV